LAWFSSSAPPEKTKRITDEMASTLDEALNQVREACSQGQPLSIGLISNAAEVFPELVRRNIIPHLVTDQTSAHDALNGYIPAGLSEEEAEELRKRDPQEYVRRGFRCIMAAVWVLAIPCMPVR
jgi:urocanate hydratase